MKRLYKFSIILNWLLLLLSCFILIVLYFSNDLNIYSTVLNVLIIVFSLVKIYLNHIEVGALKRIVQQVNKVASGNLHTRISAIDNGLMGELVCGVNRVIERLRGVSENQILLEKLRRELISDISHDIRTPLTSIIGYVDALRDEVVVSEEERQKYLQVISSKSKDLKDLIDEVFHMAKLDSNYIIMDFQVYDIGEIMRECIIEFLPELNQKEIKLKVDIPEKRSLVYCDKLSIVRVFNTIFKNAIQYASEEKVLGTELISLEDDYQINIWNRGPGIEEEYISIMFDDLYIKNKSRKTPINSMVLGRAIVKKLLKKHGGKVWVESKAHEKTVFSFTLPRLK